MSAPPVSSSPSIAAKRRRTHPRLSRSHRGAAAGRRGVRPPRRSGVLAGREVPVRVASGVGHGQDDQRRASVVHRRRIRERRPTASTYRRRLLGVRRRVRHEGLVGQVLLVDDLPREEAERPTDLDPVWPVLLGLRIEARIGGPVPEADAAVGRLEALRDLDQRVAPDARRTVTNDGPGVGVGATKVGTGVGPLGVGRAVGVAAAPAPGEVLEPTVSGRHAAATRATRTTREQRAMSRPRRSVMRPPV